jgi:hypothetical protein
MTMAQAKGSAAQVVLDFETVYGADPNSPAGILIPFNYPWDLKAVRDLKEGNTHRGRRDGAMPFYGNSDAKGGVVVPVDQVAIGYWLRALLGAPVTAPPSSDTLNNAAAVDKVGDFVGLPISGHAFVAGETVVIDGTTNYDGTHVITSKTTNEIVIPSLYVAETFAGSETVVSGVYTHVFKPADDIESLVLEAGFTDITQYHKFNGVKVNKFAMDISGDGELTAKIDLIGAKETVAGTAYDSTPTAIAFARFQTMQAAIKEGNASIATVQSLNFEINNDLDPASFVLANAVRGALPEGDCLVSGTLKALFDSEALYTKAVNGTESSLEVTFTSGLYSLNFLFQELLYTPSTPTIVKGGCYVELPFKAYFENGAADAVVRAILVNNQASYA